jgi:predicted naringenin-chalcone synthase
VTQRLHLHSLVVEAGQHSHSQVELAERFRRRLDAVEGAEDMRQMVRFVYENSSILTRHFEQEIDVVQRRPDWVLASNEATLSLARRTLGKLFDSGCPPESFDSLVVVSSTYAGFPSLGRRLQEDMGFRLDATCHDLAGLGCAGATYGLHLADLLAKAGGARRVCVLCVDVMGTYGESRVHRSPPSMSQLVGHCLASDGAAAVGLGLEPAARSILSWDDCALRSLLWSNALDENDLTATDDNEPALAVGKGLRTRIVEELSPLLEDADPEATLFHPGGAALVRVLGSAHPRFVSTLDVSYQVLMHHGNIGAASVLWVLQEALARGRRLAPTLRLFALGPGIVSTRLCLEGVEASTSAGAC